MQGGLEGGMGRKEAKKPSHGTKHQWLVNSNQARRDRYPVLGPTRGPDAVSLKFFPLFQGFTYTFCPCLFHHHRIYSFVSSPHVVTEQVKAEAICRVLFFPTLLSHQQRPTSSPLCIKSFKCLDISTSG